jgi:hypothetical protein
MTPKFTDLHKYPKGYIRSESTDVAKTWAEARRRQADRVRPAETNVHMLHRLAAA